MILLRLGRGAKAVMIQVINITSDLLVDAHSVEAVVHDVHPAVLGGEHKQRHQGVENVVKIIFLIDPTILRKLKNIKYFIEFIILSLFHLLPAIPVNTAAWRLCSARPRLGRRSRRRSP